MWVPLLALSAHATSTTTTCDMQNLPAGAEEACRCVFEYEDEEWYNVAWPAFGQLDPTATCFEYTRVVNSITGSRRTDSLNHLNPVSRYWACEYDPNGSVKIDFQYAWTLDVTGRWPVITSQVTTMAKDDCGLGGGIASLRQAFLDTALQTWLVEDEFGDLFATISKNSKFEVLRVWQFDENEDGEDDLLIWWSSKVAWIAHGPFDPTDPIPPPVL